MRLYALALTAGLSSYSFAAPDLSDFTFVWGDEFSGSTLDQDKWATAPIWGPFPRTNGEQQFYVDKYGITPDEAYDPFVLNNGILSITAMPTVTAGAVPEQPANDPQDPDYVWDQFPEYHFVPDYDASDRDHLSGIITSVNSFNFTHGYVEMRARVPAGQGLWPAFWLLNSKYVENSPEIDVMEVLGHAPNEVHHVAHYFGDDYQKFSNPETEEPTTGVDRSLDFHTYGLLWNPKEIIWYVDGVEVKRLTDAEFLVSRQSMYIIANLAVGGVWPGPPANLAYPVSFDIDYIRAYEHTTATLISPEVLTSNYVMVFNDEFDGLTLDTDKWGTALRWGPYVQINNEEQMYVDVKERHSGSAINPFTVSNGILKITADEVLPVDLPEQEAATDPVWGEYPWHFHNPDYLTSWTPAYTSGVLSTFDTFKFVHGYVEIKAKLPEGGGLWPAFWLLHSYYVWKQPEIDIMEFDGAVTDVIHHNYHWHDGAYHSEGYYQGAVPFSDSYHTYGVSWEPGKIEWYIDGQITRTFTGENVSLQLSNLIINLAVGGDFVGAIDSNFPADLLIDYVRVYQKTALQPPGYDSQRLSAVQTLIEAFEAYAASKGSYHVIGGGQKGLGRGWFNYVGGTTSESIANVLIDGGYLAAPAPTDPLHTDPGSYSVADFMVYPCEDRIGVFALSDGIEPSTEDSEWWESNDCTRHPIDGRNHVYFKLSEPLALDADAQRETAVDSIVVALEAYGTSEGTYEVSGGGQKGLGRGWFHYVGGTTPESIANVLVNGGYLAAPSPVDPLLINPGSYSVADFMIYPCEDRVGVFSLSDGIVPTLEDNDWWDTNGCTRHPIDGRNHTYFKLTEPLPEDFDTLRQIAVDTILEAFDAYASVEGSYQVIGGGQKGLGRGWFHFVGGTTPESIANVLVDGGYLVAPAPVDPTHSNPGSYSLADFMVYQCKDKVGVFSLSDGVEPSVEDSNWWNANGCTRHPIDGRNHTYFRLSPSG